MTPAKASFTPSLTRAPRLENGLGHSLTLSLVATSGRYGVGKRQ
jgi:hypothetical protein